MKRLTCIVFLRGFLLIAWVSALHSSPVAAAEKSLPVAPVAASEYKGWTNAYRLTNGDLVVVVVPSIGRIMLIGPDEKRNLLSVNQSLQGVLPASTNENNWLNFGGDWLFPVAQNRWTTFQDGDWPPSRLLDGRPWNGRAWKNADDSQCCLIQQEYGEPLHIKISRLITLPPDGSAFTIKQRVERIQESVIPITLWNITQLSAPDQLFFPTEKSDDFPDGYRMMMGEKPGAECLVECENSVAFDATCDDEIKIGSGSRESWVAGRCGSLFIIEDSRSKNQDGIFPDNGCSIELYANRGLGYAEIENLSIEKNLMPGESLANTLHIQLVAMNEEMPLPCELTDMIRKTVMNSSHTTPHNTEQ
jgi:hypothetical protein